jgi:hypothetical protein
MKPRVFLMCAALALAGCGTTPAPVASPVTATAPQAVCAPFRAWSDADLKALAEALKPVPEDSIIMRMALDWRRYYGDAKGCASR